MANQSDSVPCRLYIILARKAPTAVIFRRGPSKRVQLIHWDTATDTFTAGQWFHGRIYERRCDLSPDGKLLIYFAQKINRHTTDDTEYTYAWTAISQPPFLTALALWPKGDCWDGGGLFMANHHLWLNHPPGRTKSHKSHKPQGLTISHNEGTLGEDEPILHRRLERDGWRQSQPIKVDYTRTNAGFITHAPGIRRKHNPHGWQKLTVTSTLSGFEMHEDFSVRYAEGKDLPLDGAEWADWDQRGRLVFAREGKIFALTAEAIGESMPQELADFNGNQPEPMEAPEWAKNWPKQGPGYLPANLKDTKVGRL